MRAGSAGASAVLHAFFLCALCVSSRRGGAVRDVVYTVQMLSPAPLSQPAPAAEPAPARPRRGQRGLPPPEPRRPGDRGPAFSADDYMRRMQERLAAAAPAARAHPAPPRRERLDFSISPPAARRSDPVPAAAAGIPDWFVARIRASVRENWVPERRTAGLSAVVSFRLLRGGGADGVALERSSGNVVFDRAALDAVRRTTRFPAFPEQVAESSLDISIEFSTEE